MQTDDLAAQMVREMFGECGYEYSEKAFVDANIDIARRYIKKAITAQAEEIERLRAAVQFYAKDYNWRSSTIYMCGHSGKSSAEIDHGDKARAALKAAQEVKA